MGRAGQRSFLSLLFSAPTLTPIVLGLGAALCLRLMDPAQGRLAGFLATAGVLGGVGTLLTLLMLNGPAGDPVLLGRRQELLATLAELADGSRVPASAEAAQLATPAPLERL
jgi:hypothetical protein